MHSARQRKNWLTEANPGTNQLPGCEEKAFIEMKLATAQRSAEAGTGYFKIAWDGKEEVTNDYGKDESQKSRIKAIAWGADVLAVFRAIR